MAFNKVYSNRSDQEIHVGTSQHYQLELIGENKTVLDVGCAIGFFGAKLQERGCRVSGVEGSPTAAGHAAVHLDRVVVCDLDTADLVAEFGAESFDVINFGDVLEHLREPGTVLRNMKPLLRPGGYVVISLPNVAHGDVRLALLAGRFNYTSSGLLDDTHLRFFTLASVVALLENAGYSVGELHRTMLPLFQTEVGVSENDYPAEVVRTLRNDPEAQTYQYIASGVPHEWAEPTAEEEEMELRQQLENALDVARQAQSMCVQLFEQIELQHAEIDKLRAELAG